MTDSLCVVIRALGWVSRNTGMRALPHAGATEIGRFFSFSPHAKTPAAQSVPYGL